MLIDRVFPLDQSDTELGDAYEQRGFLGVYELCKERAEKAWSLRSEADIRLEVALMFDVSPGDIVPYGLDSSYVQAM